MRPEILFPLFVPVTSLAGIGGRTAALFEKIGLSRVGDLAWHLPVSLIDRRFEPSVMEAPDGVIATLCVTVGRHDSAPAGSRRPYRVQCYDDSGPLTLVYFHAQGDYLKALLPVGETRLVSGKVEHFQGGLQMTHPDYVVKPSDRASLPAIESVYPLTAGVTPKVMAKAAQGGLAKLPDLPEWLDAAYLKARGWAGWKASVLSAHAPVSDADLSPQTPARSRLAYDELLANQLALALVRQRMKRRKGRSLKGDGRLREKILATLPYQLTGAQRRTLDEIAADMATESAMLRLLQGDVGSGKTIVALLAMAAAIEAGTQAALLAPTEILARQHFKTLQPLAAAAGIRLAILTGRDKGRAREALLADLAAGQIDILLGTHALIQEDVAFHDLGFAVIDEQHRFGVHQRLTLAAKGHQPPDVLVMTATPIPRTLTLTVYGDMDVSKLDEKPAGRQPIDTRTISLERLSDVVAGVDRAIQTGARVYWVCPLVEESEVSDLAAAEERHASLSHIFGNRIGLVHGRMKGPEKDKAMAAFAAGETDILVATTVIEVGVDVPEATIMVIEHAERFGLSQLHQLRGRVGRGSGHSSCLLLFGKPLGETAKARLKVMRETEDGFRIAEEDLKLRGAGELLGTKQSGIPEFRLANLDFHGELLAAARDDANLILNLDPELQGPRGQALRVLLYLFERDAAVKYLQSG
jgi:ATP-dependent DNA helicase RecG